MSRICSYVLTSDEKSGLTDLASIFTENTNPVLVALVKWGYE